MITTLALAFLTGLLGGAHCIGMCGGFVMVSSAAGHRPWLFHVGRLVSYALLGALAAAAGSLLDLGGAAARFQLRHLVAGTLMLAFGLAFLGLLPRRWLEPGTGIATAAIAGARRIAGPAFPLLLGLAVGLLPCGLLYPMYAAAAGTGSPPRGALLLLAFGLGTVPLLGGLTVALGRMGLAARQRLVTAAGVAMLLLGSWMIWQGWRGAPAAPPAAHGAGQQQTS